MRDKRMMWHHSLDEPEKMLLINVKFPFEDRGGFLTLLGNKSAWYLFNAEMKEQYDENED